VPVMKFSGKNRVFQGGAGKGTINQRRDRQTQKRDLTDDTKDLQGRRSPSKRYYSQGGTEKLKKKIGRKQENVCERYDRVPLAFDRARREGPTGTFWLLKRNPSKDDPKIGERKKTQKVTFWTIGYHQRNKVNN